MDKYLRALLGDLESNQDTQLQRLLSYRQTSENVRKVVFVHTAAGLGIEPRYAASKAAVLPLDDPAAVRANCVNLLCSWANECSLYDSIPLDDPAAVHIKLKRNTSSMSEQMRLP